MTNTQPAVIDGHLVPAGHSLFTVTIMYDAMGVEEEVAVVAPGHSSAAKVIEAAPLADYRPGYRVIAVYDYTEDSLVAIDVDGDVRGPEFLR